MVKVGTSSGKGFGMTDEEMSKTYRTQRRKGTSQPKDRLSDHMVIMKNGPNANMIVKNLANSAIAWAPVFKKYGWGSKLMRNLWICFGVPVRSMDFISSSMMCENMEIAMIARHRKTFQGSAPLVDLKYQNESDRELAIIYSTRSSRLQTRITRFNNDKSYKNKIVQNNKNFNTKPADLDPFLV